MKWMVMVALAGCSQAPRDALDTEVARVPAGDFIFGCYPTTKCQPYDAPTQRQRSASFRIMKRKVTERDYVRCVEAGECLHLIVTASDRPAVVAYKYAARYCSWIGMRLPTESEWEYAARGSDGRSAPAGGDTADCSVLKRAASPFGLEGLLGHGSERVQGGLAKGGHGCVPLWSRDWVDLETPTAFRCAGD